MSDPAQARRHRDDISVLRAAHGWLGRDGRVALATVVDTWGSAPVPVGGQMVVAADGSFQGSVSGGCIEGEVITAAEEVIAGGKNRTLEFGVEDEKAWSVGLPCGGQVSVHIERLDARSGGYLAQALAASERRQGLIVTTGLETGKRTLYTPATPALPEGLADRFRSGKSSLDKTGTEPLFIQALLPPARIAVIGATHIAQILSEIARLAGYEIQIIDPRTAFASADRFPGVEVKAEWPQDALPRIGVDDYTAIVVVAHVAHIDDEALKIALRSSCLYVGALGSKRNHAKRKVRLAEAGMTPAEIARIKCPIGLDIGAQSPAEIAVAIMAEVILAVRGTKAGRKDD